MRSVQADLQSVHMLVEHEAKGESHHAGCGLQCRQNLCVEYIFVVRFYVAKKISQLNSAQHLNRYKRASRNKQYLEYKLIS